MKREMMRTYLRANYSKSGYPSAYSTKQRKHFDQGICWTLLCGMATKNLINQLYDGSVDKHTSKPHSGTRSRLLNIVIRSHTLTPFPVPINLAGSDDVKPRKRPLEACHFLMAPTPTRIIKSVSIQTKICHWTRKAFCDPHPSDLVLTLGAEYQSRRAPQQ